MARPAGDDGQAPVAGTLLLRLGLGIFLAINIMVFSWFFYSGEWFGDPARAPEEYRSLVGLFSYLLMLLATAVLALLGLPLAADVLANLRGDGRLRERIDVNLLICVGVAAAYGISVAGTLSGEGSLYYDTASMVLVLVTLGNYLEAGARRRATDSAGAVLAELPTQVRVRRDGSESEMKTGELRAGDLLLARCGEALAADGRVRQGSSRIDEARMTGESMPRAVGPGDELLAGSINLDGPLWVEASRTGDDAAISRMQRMLETARLERPPIQRLADRIAALFVPGVVLLAAVVFAWRAYGGSPEAGLFAALSVVLISCPCALGLAAPLACWNALRRAAGQGIVIDSAATLERLSRVSRIFFDKTGTLTDSEPGVASIEPSEGLDAEGVLGLSAALESACLHPVARGLIREARERGVKIPEAVHVTVHPGLGVEGEVESVVYGLGGVRFLESRGLELPGSAKDAEGIAVYLFDAERVLAAFELAEQLRPDAGRAVSTLAGQGIGVEILTGDRTAPAARIGRLLGIPVSGELLPGDKLARLNEARESGACVAMVGDGINDGPVLAAADVGIATGSATDLARQAGNVRLIGDRLDRVPLTLAISRDCMRRIRFNLAWAFGYNGIGITLAALGLLSPIFAASAMFVSSLVIVMVSRRAGCVEQARMEP